MHGYQFYDKREIHQGERDDTTDKTQNPNQLEPKTSTDLRERGRELERESQRDLLSTLTKESQLSEGVVAELAAA